MPVLTMYRNGEVAYVNTDHAATYENFLANGWTETLETVKADVSPEPEAEASVPEDEVPAPAVEAAPKRVHNKAK